MQGRSGHPSGDPHHTFLISHISTWASLTRALPPQTQCPKFQLLHSASQVPPPIGDIKPPHRFPKSTLQRRRRASLHLFSALYESYHTRTPSPASPSAPRIPTRALDPRDYNSWQALQKEPVCRQGLLGKAVLVGFTCALMKRSAGENKLDSN